MLLEDAGADRGRVTDRTVAGDSIIGTEVPLRVSRRRGHAGFSAPAPLRPASTKGPNGLPACDRWAQSASRRSRPAACGTSVTGVLYEPVDLIEGDRLSPVAYGSPVLSRYICGLHCDRVWASAINTFPPALPIQCGWQLGLA